MLTSHRSAVEIDLPVRYGGLLVRFVSGARTPETGGQPRVTVKGVQGPVEHETIYERTWAKYVWLVLKDDRSACTMSLRPSCETPSLETPRTPRNGPEHHDICRPSAAHRPLARAGRSQMLRTCCPGLFPHPRSGRREKYRFVSRLSSLLRQVEKQDPQLAADLKREVDALSGRRAFGLNFERHIPETVELPRPTGTGEATRSESCRIEAVKPERCRPIGVCGGLKAFGGPAGAGWPTWSRKQDSEPELIRATSRAVRRFGGSRRIPRSDLPGADLYWQG